MIATSLLLRIVVLVMRDSDSGKNGDLWMLDTFLEDLCGPLEVVGQPCPFHFLPTEDVQSAYESLSPIQTAQRIGFTAYKGLALLPTTDWLYCLQRSSDSGLQVGRLPICFRQEAQRTWAACRQQPSDELSHPLRIWELYAAECPVLEEVSESRLRPPESKNRVVMLSCLLSRRPRPSTPRELAEGPWHSKNRRCCSCRRQGSDAASTARVYCCPLPSRMLVVVEALQEFLKNLSQESPLNQHANPGVDSSRVRGSVDETSS